MTQPLRAYLIGTSAPAAAVALLLPIASAAPAADPSLALVLVVLAALATNYQVTVTPRYKADAAPAVHFAIVLLFSPAAAVALVGLAALAGESVLWRRRKRAPIDIGFNTSQLMIAAGGAAILYRGIRNLSSGDAASLAAAVAAACAMYVMSTALVGLAVALHSRRRPIDVWGDMASAELKQVTGLYVAGFLLAVMGARSPWLAIGMMAPIAGVQLYLKRSIELREQTVAAVESMANLVDRRDPYTFQHSQSVAAHAVRTAKRLNLPDREVELIGLAARVHDLGKIAVPDAVLHKQGRLTDEEFALMKKHPDDGAEILAKFPGYRRGRELVLAHHERMDGRGYPRGLSGAQIPLGARLIAVADAWDAMTSDRPYRMALSQDVALAELMRGRGTQWDAAVVEAFAAGLPGVEPVEVDRPEGLAAPLLRSLGAVAGILS